MVGHPWNYVERCDAFGANCHTGFHTIFYYYLGGGPLEHWGIDGSERETATFSDFYATPALALAHALPPLQLVTTAPTSFRAFIPDCCYGDNTGGLTIAVVSPEPSTSALVGTGLFGLWIRRRQRRSN